MHHQADASPDSYVIKCFQINPYRLKCLKTCWILRSNINTKYVIIYYSNRFAKTFGLKVAHPPPGVQSEGSGDELVCHFLVEPTTRGVWLKGFNEPVFTSLWAPVYKHSITPHASPCKLIIPDHDLQNVEYYSPTQQQLMTQGAACNVLFLFTCGTERLTGIYWWLETIAPKSVENKAKKFFFY